MMCTTSECDEGDRGDKVVKDKESGWESKEATLVNMIEVVSVK